MSEFTHAELVARAVTWLRGQRCTIVLAECGAWFTQEIPDAIGWRPRGISVLVECKSTRADFRRDRTKPSRRNGEPMGSIRWYLAPAGVIPIEELPEGWGLVEVVRLGNRRLRAVVTHKAREPDRPWGKLTSRETKEVALLVAELRRVQLVAAGEIRPRRVGLQVPQSRPTEGAA